MTSTFDTVITTAFIPLFVAAIVWLWSFMTLTKRLEYDYPETFRALGEPRLHFGEITLQEAKAQLRLIKFVLMREHQSLNDANLSRKCDFMRLVGIAFFVGFLALLLYAGRSQ